MALPATEWLPTRLDDDRFIVVDMPLPRPFVASYHDFSTQDATTELTMMAMNVIAVGAGNEAIGVTGRTAAFAKALTVTFIQRNVYGVLLVDTLFVPPLQSAIDF